MTFALSLISDDMAVLIAGKIGYAAMLAMALFEIPVPESRRPLPNLK
jgi:hypothetical protein